MVELKEKVATEYEIFFLDLMRTSRENIFAHAQEVAAKKEIKNILVQLEGELEPELVEKLFLQSNVLEAAFCYYEKNYDGQRPETMRAIVWKWIASMDTKKGSEARKGWL